MKFVPDADFAYVIPNPQASASSPLLTYESSGWNAASHYSTIASAKCGPKLIFKCLGVKLISLFTVQYCNDTLTLYSISGTGTVVDRRLVDRNSRSQNSQLDLGNAQSG